MGLNWSEETKQLRNRGLDPPISGSSSSKPSVDALLLDQSRLKTELAEVKATLAEVKVLNANRHEDLMSIPSILTAKFSSPSPWISSTP